MTQIAHSRAAAAVDIPGLPYTLRPNRLFAFLCGFFGVLFTLFAFAGQRETSRDAQLGIEIIFGVLAVLCFAGLAQLLTLRARLESDRVVGFSLLGRNELQRSDIAGYRRAGATSTLGPTLLIPSVPGVRPIRLPGGRRPDAMLLRWLDGYPDLTPGLNPPPVVWHGSPASAARASLALNIVAIAISAWAFFLPRPAALALVAAAIMPWTGVAAVRITYGTIAFSRPRGQGGPTAAFVLIWPTIALALHVIVDFDIFDWGPVLIAALVGGAAAMAGYVLVFPWMRAGHPMWWLGPALFGMAYAFGAFANADRVADRSAGQEFRPEVVDKYVTHGRSTSYHLKLAPWGPRTDTESVDVRYGVYQDTRLGGHACVVLHPGALGMRWYTVAPPPCAGDQTGSP